MDRRYIGGALGGDGGARSFDGEGGSCDGGARRGGVMMLGGAMAVLLAPLAEVRAATAEL